MLFRSAQVTSSADVVTTKSGDLENAIASSNAAIVVTTTDGQQFDPFLPELQVSGGSALLSQADGTIVYFSFVTLTSTGFGDVTPFHPIVRTLSNVEAIIGQLFPATLLARLITLELRGYRQRS